MPVVLEAMLYEYCTFNDLFLWPCFSQKWKWQQMSSRFKDLSTSMYLGAQPGPREEQSQPTMGVARGEYLTLGLSHRWHLAFQLVGCWEPGNATPCLLWEFSCISGTGHGGDTGYLGPVPPVHATHSPVADHCHPRVLVQLSTSWAPTYWKRLEVECRDTQDCPFLWDTPTAVKQGLPQSSWIFALPVNTLYRHDIAPHVVNEEQDLGTQNANGKTDSMLTCTEMEWWCRWHLLGSASLRLTVLALVALGNPSPHLSNKTSTYSAKILLT